MTKRELKAQWRALEARVAELERLVQSMRRDEVRTDPGVPRGPREQLDAWKRAWDRATSKDPGTL